LRNTAQGLYAALAGGVLLSSITWMSGPIYEAYGGKGFLAMALISAIGVIIAIHYIRTNPKAPDAVAA
jgi:MFS transporter, PPP family, 3-phenylpropionic acid transporter